MNSPPPSLHHIRQALRALADPQRAVALARYFKTAPSQYAEGDKFLGLRVPDVRRVVRAHRALAIPDALELLQSQWHEERLAALLILVRAHERGAIAKDLAVCHP